MHQECLVFRPQQDRGDLFLYQAGVKFARRGDIA